MSHFHSPYRPLAGPSSPQSPPLPYLSLINPSTCHRRRRPVSRFRLLELILLCVAISCGCLCYLTIYYHLTTNTEGATDTASSGAMGAAGFLSRQLVNSRQFQATSSVNGTERRRKHKQTNGGEKQAQLDISSRSFGSEESGLLPNEPPNSELALSESVIATQQHVSEFLTDHVQLLAVKASHRLETIKHSLTLQLTGLYSSQSKRLSCGSKLKAFLYPTTPKQTSPFDDPLLFQRLETSESLSPCDVLLFLQQNVQKHPNLSNNSVLFKAHPEAAFTYVSSFPLLNRIFNNLPSICDLFRSVDFYSEFKNQPVPLFTPLCASLNTSISIVRHFSQSLASNQSSLSSQFLSKPHLFSQNTQTQNTFFTQTHRLRLIVLLTSLNPLRASLYNDQLERTEFTRSLNETQKLALNLKIRKTLLQTLVLLDISDKLINLPELQTEIGPFSSAQPFQLLAFDLEIADSLDQIWIIDITDYLSLNLPSSGKQKLILNETLNLLQTPPSSQSFSRLLHQMTGLLNEDTLGLQGVSCQQSHRVCLTHSDLSYLIDTLPHTTSGRFTLLYPISSHSDAIYRLGSLFETVLLRLAQKPEKSGLESHFEYHTERLFSLLSLLDLGPASEPKQGPNHSQTSEEPHEPHFDLTNLNSPYHSLESQPAGQKVPETSDDEPLPVNCSTHFEALPHLSRLSILIPDYLVLQPEFNSASDRVHYSVNRWVNYEDLLLSLSLSVAHCDAWIRVESQVLFQSGILNFTLGLGENTLNINLVTSNSALLASISLTIHRLTREEQFYKSAPEVPELRICSLSQDCSMDVFPGEPCGLQETGLLVESLSDYFTEKWINKIESPYTCTTGHARGRWLLPCGACTDESTCSWAHLEWRPFNCHYKAVETRDQLVKCFNKKHILLLGDSTNRGISHYLLERLNGTLSEADKTHNLKRYTLNSSADLSVSLTFAYYPKFWIPLQKRPSFADLLSSLLEDLISREDGGEDEGANLIAIIGGVQWIAGKHLHIIEQVFKQFRLSKARILIKTLGSGFHQPVNGVHYMPLSEQRKLAFHNGQLIEEAVKYNFQVVDTFNKTIALYRDFYPGKCACHFHKIVKHSTSGAASSSPPAYHVEGRLNRLYSEIVLSQICLI